MNYDRYLNPAIAAVPPSGIRRFFDMASTMKGTISLGVGEPDFVTPYHIRHAAIDSLLNGETSYTANRGLPALREEISCYMHERFSLPVGEPLIEAESRMTPELEKYREEDRRKIYPSWLDGLGHVNNSRYGDMIFDTLSAAGAYEGALRRLELYFVGELHEGEEVSLLLRREPGSASVLGVHGQSGEAAFCSRVFFE